MKSATKSNLDLIDSTECMKKIRAAQARLTDHAHITPVHTSESLNRKVGHEVFLKCENFQKVGAFKFRGAFNAISCLSHAQRANGVLTYSSGNHAQAMALAGKMLNTQVTVVMPNNAPAAKLAATREYGAQVVLYDPLTDQREDIAARLPVGDQAILIPPFDHYDVIAGQGTAALEFHQWYQQHHTGSLSALFVPVGGGGLLAGSAVASHFVSPDTRVFGVEPEQADDAAQSMRQGKRVHLDNIDTIADGTRTPCVGQKTFPLMQELVEDIITVSEQAIEEAVAYLFQRLKIVVEPSGALGVAALLQTTPKEINTAGVILSGGNVDTALFTRILNDHLI